MEAEKHRSAGFLGFETNWFDRLFIGAMVLIALHLLWLRFIEPLHISLWFCMVISLVVGAVIFWKG